jgi:Enoyl-CoA hydratase/carnithine racemase
MSESVRFEQTRHESMLVVRFAHARSRNALDRATRAALVDVLRDADADPDVRVVILTGTDPAFTSGVDARQLLEPDYRPLPVDPATALRALDTPTIAAVNGACVSGGLEIALACSFIIASERAAFADTHARLGLTPGWGLSADLPARVGAARARQLSLTGLPLDAETALRWGLVNEVVVHAELHRRVEELAAAIATASDRSIRNTVALSRSALDDQVRAARQRERHVLATWHVDRDDARLAFDQRVSPPST